MKLKALRNFSGAYGSFNAGQVFTIENVTVADDFIAAGYAVEVETCQTCGSTVEKTQ